MDAAEEAGQDGADDERRERDDDGDLGRDADHDDVRAVKARRLRQHARRLVVVAAVAVVLNVFAVQVLRALAIT